MKTKTARGASGVHCYRIFRSITVSRPRYTASSGRPTPAPKRQSVMSRSDISTRGNDHAFSSERGSRSGRFTSQFAVCSSNFSCAGFNCGNRFLESRAEVGDAGYRSESLCTLRAGHAGEIDIGFGNALPDPAIFDWPVPHAGHTFLVQFVIEEGAIVGNDDQQRNAVMRRGPKRSHAHEEIAIAAHRNGKAAAALERQRCADRDSWTAADATAAIGAKIVERMAEMPTCAVPRQGNVGE